jgi:hypothetical protein
VDKVTFREFLAEVRALPVDSDYRAGYERGLRRHYYGEGYGHASDHELLLRRRDAVGRGYRDGVDGKAPDVPPII